MHQTVVGLVTSYGYVVLFILIAIESVGVPLPGETALVTAAALAAQGQLSIAVVLATAIAAAIVGDNGGYWIGRRGGLPLLRRYGRVVHVDEGRLERAHAFFERHGARTVFLGRFIALLRTWAAVLAGTAGMPYGAFMLSNALGAVCWSVLVGGLGYALGRNLPRLERYLGQASLAGALLVALVVALGLGWRWFAANRSRLAMAAAGRWQRFVAAPALGRLRARYPRVATFVMDRFARGEYLGLHLTLGLAVSLAGLWVFGGITEDVIHHDPLTAFDVALLNWIEAHATARGYAIASVITQLGSPSTMAVVGGATSLVLAFRRQWLLFGAWVAALGGGGLLNVVIKHVIERPRPPSAGAFLHDQSWSFPSGHAMGSLVGYGMLAYLLISFWSGRPGRQMVVALGAALLILAIGASRLYLGVHYFSDVVGGYAAGVLWLSACISGCEVARRWRPPLVPSVKRA